MKRIKFPLIMKNGAEVRQIADLRENYDMESLVEYFANGKLEQWLESNYYDDMLNMVRVLTGEEEDFDVRLAESLGIEWKNEGDFNPRRALRKTQLREQVKPYISEEKLNEIEYIAGTQKELEEFVNENCTPIYLFGQVFVIPAGMKETTCIGINNPIVKLEIKSAEEYRKKKNTLKDVSYPDKETKKIAVEDPIVESYVGLLEILRRYLKTTQTILNQKGE